MTVRQWCDETGRLLELTEAAFELAFCGLPPIVPSEVFLHMRRLRFENSQHRDRIEREIADAFFLRLKGLLEARLKALCKPEKPNWKSAECLLYSIGCATDVRPVLSADDQLRLGQFCALRNCIAHNDGIVDEVLHDKIPGFAVGTDVWMTQATASRWFELCRRLVEAIRKTNDAASQCRAQQAAPPDGRLPSRRLQGKRRAGPGLRPVRRPQVSAVVRLRKIIKETCNGKNTPND